MSATKPQNPDLWNTAAVDEDAFVAFGFVLGVAFCLVALFIGAHL